MPKVAINEEKLNKLVASGKSHKECAEALKITQGQLDMLTFGKAQVAAGNIAKVPATEKGVKDARDKKKLRWEYIAAASGLSTSKVKALYGGEDVAKTSSVPRGRKPGSDKNATPARARTRADRAAKSGNPS